MQWNTTAQQKETNDRYASMTESQKHVNERSEAQDNTLYDSIYVKF